ncbi:MAG: metallophosphatase [Bacteroides sp.]
MKNINRQDSKRIATWLGTFCVCLLLSAQEVKELTILHTNDTHSRIEPIEKSAAKQADKAGYVRRATFIQEARKENKDILLFDSGDFSQGSPYYNMFRGEVEIGLMNEMGYNAGTIGNHEFDFGLDNMLRIFKMAKFPIVSANYNFKGTVLENIVKPYTIIKRNGLKIGVFGLGPKLDGLVQAKNCEGVEYLNPYEEANKIASLLKNEKSCDLVICLSHLGWKSSANDPICDETLIPSTRNIDIVLGGHSHSFFEKPIYYKNADGKEIPLQQMGKNGVYVGKMNIKLMK